MEMLVVPGSFASKLAQQNSGVPPEDQPNPSSKWLKPATPYLSTIESHKHFCYNPPLVVGTPPFLRSAIIPAPSGPHRRPFGSSLL